MVNRWARHFEVNVLSLCKEDLQGHFAPKHFFCRIQLLNTLGHSFFPWIKHIFFYDCLEEGSHGGRFGQRSGCRGCGRGSHMGHTGMIKKQKTKGFEYQHGVQSSIVFVKLTLVDFLEIFILFLPLVL